MIDSLLLQLTNLQVIYGLSPWGVHYIWWRTKLLFLAGMNAVNSVVRSKNARSVLVVPKVQSWRKISPKREVVASEGDPGGEVAHR